MTIPSASVEQEDRPSYVVDIGVLGGRGTQADGEALAVYSDWTRIGPEVVGSALWASGFSVGVGLGYQVASYGRSGGIRRHDMSARLIVQYHLDANGLSDQAFGVGLGCVDSFPGSQTSSLSHSTNYETDHLRGTAFFSYWPSFRLSEHLRLGVELVIAGWPSPVTLEGVVRLGIQYRF